MLAQDTPARKYSPDVVAKAEQILQTSGLRRSGKMIQASETSDISRAIANLTREKRELRLIDQEWQKVADQIAANRQELQRLNAQDGELNLQLARVAKTDVKSSNQLIALLNASRARAQALIDQRERWAQELAAKRSEANQAETNYADTVIAIRKEYASVRTEIAKSLQDDQVQIALRVMQANFQTPPSLTADDILSALDKRIAKIEQEIFREAIELQVKGGALYVDVVVGKKTIPMVIDSGASLVCLPTQTAVELGIEIPLDAREIKLLLADGRSIPARGVTLERVRIGQFEAEDVEAAVMDAVAVQAEPLLGMSFLKNFKFEIDTNEKRLKMLRVATE